MSGHFAKVHQKRYQSPNHEVVQSRDGGKSSNQFVDHRFESSAQRRMKGIVNDSPYAEKIRSVQLMADSSLGLERKVVQQKKNDTGLPDALKSGVERLSGYSMDDVKVHYNSARPGQLQAHAFAQGADIHLAPGQEKHLPHEAWHVVQQEQGRVRPTKQMKDGTSINDDVRLESEADTMGSRALAIGQSN